jgi:hypothetical protein
MLYGFKDLWALKEISEHEMILEDKYCHALCVIMDGVSFGEWIFFDHLHTTRKYK